MHPGTLRALEFDRVVEALTSFALTPFGAEKLEALAPVHDPRRVEVLLTETTEGVRLLAAHPGLPLRAPGEIRLILDGLAVEGRPLEPLRLIGLADCFDSIAQARNVVRRLPREEFPILSALADAIGSFDRVIAEVRRALDPSGDVLDAASPELAHLRERLRRQRSRLRSMLESYVRGRDTARYLQDLVVTDRNGRYVLVVKAEHRQAIPGIVHGSSSSGASLYLEPLSTVELNNEIVSLEQQEAEEIRRILLNLTDAFRGRAVELRLTLDAAMQLDVIQAKARFAAACEAVPPVIAAEGGIELRAARHPLLIPAVLARIAADDERTITRDQGPVPVDILLRPPTRVLVITGPNTGGKTVALKATGLLSLMAQAGLHIPADAGSSLPVFQTVFADLGDEQSIAANLSTFSWHVTNIVNMDRGLKTPALVLLDEVGAGTDPLEGGSLGMAIVEHFRKRGAFIVATTHYDALKSYASTTEGVVAAAFGFDPNTFAPTYLLRYGSPGSSLALEIAGLLGLAPSIVEAARAFRSSREAQLAEHLAKIDRDMHELEHERRLATREREHLADLEAQYKVREEALRQREERSRQRSDDAVQERLRAARKEIDAIVEQLRTRAAGLADDAARRVAAVPHLVQPISTGDVGSLKTEALVLLDRAADRARGNQPVAEREEARESGGAIRRPIEVGARVVMGPLGIEGIVQEIYDATAEVNVNGKRLRASLDDLRVVSGAPVEPAAPRVTVHLNASVSEGSMSDLNVIGCTVVEALERTDKFLDQALLAELRQVRVIHGHGTGQLRRALAAHLKDHPLVLRIAPAPAEQGGGGVTMVELKD
jgi:DNA mismatch repair protein MutS2